jgi:hypothetical protein
MTSGDLLNSYDLNKIIERKMFAEKLRKIGSICNTNLCGIKYRANLNRLRTLTQKNPK